MCVKPQHVTTIPVVDPGFLNKSCASLDFTVADLLRKISPSEEIFFHFTALATLGLAPPCFKKFALPLFRIECRFAYAFEQRKKIVAREKRVTFSKALPPAI